MTLLRWPKLRLALLLFAVLTFLIVIYFEKTHREQLYSLSDDQRLWQERVELQSTLIKAQRNQIENLAADIKELRSKMSSDTSKRYIQSTTGSLPDVQDISSMRKFATNVNRDGWNALKMFSRRRGTLHLLLVQVHSRHSLLLQLLSSLQESLHESRYHGNKDNVMVVITHDMYSEELHSVISNRWKFNLVQLYFPCSRTLFNNTFPATHPNDCPRTAGLINSECHNSKYPDLNGHYRDVKYTQIKHHFWWKLCSVRRVVPTAVLTLLEEDNYVSPDFFYILDIMDSISKKNCTDCDLMFLTTGSEYELDNTPPFNKALSQMWSKVSGYGFIMTTHLLDQLFNNYHLFCSMDDYNQDWTMFQMGHSVFRSSVTEIRLTQSRVFHTGACGFHYNNSDCNILLKEVKNYIAVNDHYYFPTTLDIVGPIPPSGPVHYKPLAGEWSDIRDHRLCQRLYHSEFLTSYQYSMCIVEV